MRSKSALLVVDLQPDFLPGGALAVVDWHTRLLPTKVIAPSYFVVAALAAGSAWAEQDLDALITAGLGWLVPAFLAIELIVDSYLAEPFVVRLEGAPPLLVGAGRTSRMDLDGRRPGRYPIDFGDAGQALLVTGAEPGP